MYSCPCKTKKSYRLTLDGASTGSYKIEICNDCYKNNNLEFLLKEEML